MLSHIDTHEMAWDFRKRQALQPERRWEALLEDKEVMSLGVFVLFQELDLKQRL